MAQEVIHHNDSGGNNNFLLGILILVVFIFLFFYFGLPRIREVKEGTQINVPDQIDVNIKQEDSQ